MKSKSKSLMAQAPFLIILTLFGLLQCQLSTSAELSPTWSGVSAIIGLGMIALVIVRLLAGLTFKR